MEEKRKQQLLMQADNAYKSWTKGIKSRISFSEVDITIEEICNALAFGTIIVSGRHNPASYIGTHKQCQKLKQTFGGQVGMLNNNCYWIGIASADDIRRIVHNQRKNFQVSVPESDIVDTIFNLGEVASLDVKYSFKECNFAVYIGCYMVCILLKRSFGGKIGRKHNHWYWKGSANLYQINNIIATYQKTARRYRRKKIILTF